jgi:UPF0271 protein
VHLPRIDLNSDVGESFGSWRMGQDEEVIPHVSSVNVACGFHAGDPLVMTRTVEVARANGVAVGAHPGYADLAGFGRRDIDMLANELEAGILYQLGALAAIARAAGVELQHVKAHGALYNKAAADVRVATTLVGAVRRFSRELVFVGLAGSAMVAAAADAGLRTAAEAFADRAYEPTGSLRSRREPDALLTDPDQVARRAVEIARDGRVSASDGTVIELRADTICLHGDTPGAATLAATVRAALEAAGVRVLSLGASG